MESILTSIKKLLGIADEYTHFDNDIVLHINSVFMTLNQIGVGPPEGFTIADEYATWDQFIGDNTQIEAVKTYVYLKVRILFDPPANSVVMESINRMINEFEWRLKTAMEL